MDKEEMDELIFLWREYGLEKNSNLTKDAIELKKEVLVFVEALPKLTGRLKND